jgi:sialidase-1
MPRSTSALLVSLLFLSPLLADERTPVSKTDVFIAGQDGYHTYRIPSVIRTSLGTLVAFCEGRRRGKSDAGDIDLVYRLSTDAGQTWSPLRVLWDDGPNTAGNPCPVVVPDDSSILILMTWNDGAISESKVRAGFGDDSRRVFLARSKDDAITWSTPVDITSTVKRPEWTWYATGPGAGIVIERGPYTGRVVIPCDHKEPGASEIGFFSHVIFSDDRGATWQIGGRTTHATTNECEVVETDAGSLLLNMRSYRKDARSRQIAVSLDGGQTWNDQRVDPTLVDPICQASIRRFSWPSNETPGLILFSNAAHHTQRRNLTVRGSDDDGANWPMTLVIEPGSAAYSCLCAVDDANFGCLYERDNYGKITFARIHIDQWQSTRGK